MVARQRTVSVPSFLHPAEPATPATILGFGRGPVYCTAPSRIDGGLAGRTIFAPTQATDGGRVGASPDVEGRPPRDPTT